MPEEATPEALWAYFNALVEQGFRRNEALQLTLNYQTLILAPSLEPDGDGPG